MVLNFGADTKKLAMVPLVLLLTDFLHRLTDFYLSKLIMIGQTFREISKFSSVNPGLNTAIQLNFLVPFSYVCITLIKKTYLQKNYIIFTLQNEGIYWYHALSHNGQTPSAKVLKDFLLIFVAKTKYFTKWVLTKIT